MRREFRQLLVVLLALSLGGFGAVLYARAAAPYLLIASRLLAAAQPWKVQSVTVTPAASGLGNEVRLDGYVYRRAGDSMPAARVLGHLSVGEVVEVPVVFWGVLGLWPASSGRQRLAMFATGLPVFVVLAGVLAGTQLLVGLAGASAILAGDNDPVTLWDRISQFLEAGGLFVIVVSGALMVMAAVGAERSPIHGWAVLRRRVQLSDRRRPPVP